MATFKGTVAVTALPPHRGISVSLCFFGVASSEEPAPYDGDPPSDACTDCDAVFEQVDLRQEFQESRFETHFSIERLPGYYYVQVGVILYRAKDGEFFAQVEPSFFARRPVRVPADEEGQITFPVSWPAIPLDHLQVYGKLSPRRKRLWWRFW